MIKVKEYTMNSLHNVLGEINCQIEEYEKKYRKRPILIIISNELEVLFREELQLMNQYGMININDDPIVVNKLFGFSCIASPTLTDLQFEIR